MRLQSMERSLGVDHDHDRGITNLPEPDTVDDTVEGQFMNEV